MNQNQYDNIENALTQIRLLPYTGKNKEDTINNYLNNIEVCRSFYPLLHFFEVSLRNAIDKALTDYVNGKEWFDILPMDSKSIQKINDAKKTIKLHNHVVTHDRIVAELSLGFWTSFVSKKFSQYPYQGYMLKNAFPNCPKYMRTAKIMQKRFEDFRILRNRISHCERINHFQNLNTLHTELLESINWIESEVGNLATKMDNVQNSFTFKVVL
ncbi:MAG: Abi family protein [Treponema sp.]|nr:Abi family protein [Treponema sp.]